MLREIFANTGIEPDKAATLLGISPDLFREWIANQRPIPHSVLGVLSNVLGIDLTPFVQRKVPSQQAADNTPAIWYRFRGDRLVPEDRECVFLIRRLGYFVHELEEVTGAKAVGWNALFQEIRQNVDIQAPPRTQGVQAANMFRESRGLSVGATGIGEIIRGNLRALGLLVIETPVPKSQLEGCCFYVGNRPAEKPCVFANTHHTTWFRRNLVILHEVAHAIFDAASAGATLDFLNDEETNALSEERADAFAQQVMVPRQVLRHVAQKSGINWQKLAPGSLARLLADTHVEKRTLLRAALEGQLVSQSELDEYLGFDVRDILPSVSKHALSTAEYIRSSGDDANKWLGKRNTTISSMTLRLPTPYVKAVLAAYQRSEISRGKAAEMLMIDDDVFLQRFGTLVPSVDDTAGDEKNLAFSY